MNYYYILVFNMVHNLFHHLVDRKIEVLNEWNIDLVQHLINVMIIRINYVTDMKMKLFFEENTAEIETKTDIVAAFTCRYLLSKRFTLTNDKKEVIDKSIFMDKQLDGGFVSYYMINDTLMKVVVVTSIDFIRIEFSSDRLSKPIVIRTNVVDIGDKNNWSAKNFNELKTKLDNKMVL